MSTTMRSGLGRVWELEEKVATLAIDLGSVEAELATLEEWVTRYRELLPGDKKPQETAEVLRAFAEKAVQDIGTLMGACIDYRNVLIQASVGDPVSGRHEGVEAIMKRYGVKIEPKRTAGVEYLNAYISNVTY